MTHRVLELDAGRLVYQATGSGPLVVLTHAFGPLAWGAVDRLGEACSVALPDWEQTTLERRAQLSLSWFEPLVRDLGHEQGALCAWSMSGPLAIEFAAEEPEALSRLILVDVAGLKPEMPALRLRELPHFIATRLLGRPTRGFVRALWRNWVWQPELDTRELQAATLRFFRANPDAIGSPTNEDEGEGEEDDSLLDELAYVQVPTLVLAGRHSQVLGAEYGRTAAERLARGELVVFEHSGHSLQLEENARFQEVVAAFAARLP